MSCNAVIQLNRQVIAIDDKTLRRSFDVASGKAAIHMVSARATANHSRRQGWRDHQRAAW